MSEKPMIDIAYNKYASSLIRAIAKLGESKQSIRDYIPEHSVSYFSGSGSVVSPGYQVWPTKYKPDLHAIYKSIEDELCFLFAEAVPDFDDKLIYRVGDMGLQFTIIQCTDVRGGYSKISGCRFYTFHSETK